MKIAEVKTYEYSELSEKAKEKALEHYSDINTDFDWWDFDCLTGFSDKEMKKYRLHDGDSLLTYEHMYFDIDRGAYLQFDKASFRDDEQARRFLGLSKKLWNDTHFTFKTAGRNSSTELEYEPQDWEREYTDKEKQELDTAVSRFSDKVSDCLDILRKEYEYQSSREAIEETIKANEYRFTINGQPFNY